MAIGDAAAAAGMALVPSSGATGSPGKVKQGWEEINRTRDYIATQAGGTQPVAKGGTGATTAAAARDNLDVAHDAIGGLKFTSPGFGIIAWEAPGVAFPTTLARFVDIPDLSGYRTLSDGQFGSVPIYSPHGRANGVSGGLTAYLGADGRLAVAPSSRRFKKDIKTFAPNIQAVLAIEIVQFYYKAAIDSNGILEHGVIAEQLVELGLDWLVAYDETGEPFGVHYEKIALALLPVIQDHERRLTALENPAGE